MSEQRAQWAAVDLKDIVPAQLTQLVHATATPISAIANALGSVNTALSVAKSLIIGFPGFDVASALAMLLDNFRRDLEGAGVFYLPVWDGGLDEMILEGAKSAYLDLYKHDPEYQGKVKSFFINRYQAAVQGAEQSWADLTNPDPQPGAMTLFQKLDAAYSTPTGNSWGNFIGKILSSFDDTGDQSRPQFTSGETAAVIFLVGAPTLAEFGNLLLQLLKLFPKMDGLDKTVCQYLRILLAGVDPAHSGLATMWTYPEKWPPELANNPDCVPSGRKRSIEAGQSYPPDWKALRLKDITTLAPVFEIVDNVMLQLIGLLKVSSNAKEAILKLINAIQLKVQQLQKIAALLADLIHQLDLILGATGIYVLYAHAEGGVEGLKRAILNADISNVKFAQPTNKKLSGTTTLDAYLSGCMFMAGGPSIKPFETFFAGLGKTT